MSTHSAALGGCADAAPEGWVQIAEAARDYSIRVGTLTHWTRTGKLEFRSVRRATRGGRSFYVDPAAVAGLVVALNERKAKDAQRKQCAPRPKRKVALGTCRAGLEPDMIEDAVSECDAVRGTLGHDGLVWTPHDLRTLAARREQYAAYLGRAA
jgi:hypothetical protein